MAITTITYNGTVLDSTNNSLPVEIKYGENTLISLNPGDNVKLKCGFKLLSNDILIGIRKLIIKNKYAISDVDVNVADYTRLNVPSITGQYVYNGSLITPNISGFDSDLLNVSGDLSGINAGSYRITFSIKDKTSYCWNDGSQTDKTIEWTISKASLTIPSQDGKLVYNGSSLSPTWKNYDSSKMSISGVTSAIEVGEYTVTFTITNSNYQFTDGTTVKNVQWAISEPMYTVTITNSGNNDYCHATINGTKRYSSGSWDVQRGNTITLFAKGDHNKATDVSITVNGTKVQSTTGTKSVSYSYTVNSNCRITFGYTKQKSATVSLTTV